jgi:hypothetical protein
MEIVRISTKCPRAIAGIKIAIPITGNERRSNMNKPTVIDKRQVRLEEILRSDYIPFLGGRPQRELIISRDEIFNLTIILNTTSSTDEFLRNI